MSYANNLANNYDEPRRISSVREITWDQTEAVDEATVFQKVNQWLMLHEKTKPIVTEEPSSFPDEIPASPIVSRRRISKSSKSHQNPVPKFVDIANLKTPPKRHNSIPNDNITSPICRRKPMALRKRRLFKSSLEIKPETSILNSDIKSCENTFANENHSSPVMITKRYTNRKRERSFSIKEESSQNISDTVLVKIEELEDSPRKKKRPLALKFDVLKSPSIINSTQQIETVESDDEDKQVKENENIIVDTCSFYGDEVEAKHIVIEDLCSQEMNIKDTVKIETALAIEDTCSQEIDMKDTVKIDIVANASQDSDETYCTLVEQNIENVENINTSQSSQLDIQSVSVTQKKESEKISQVSTVSSVEKTIINKSGCLNTQGSSGGDRSKKFNFSTISNNRRKKKHQKNSLLDKLRNLVGTAASYNRLWRHQMAHPRQFQQFQKLFVMLEIQKSYPFNGRLILECRIINDDNKLLNANLELNVTDSITIIVIPEIVGTITDLHENCIKLYQPWKIVDRKNRLIEASNFIFESNTDINYDKSPKESREKCVKKFNCLCLINNKISQECDIKFKNVKPSIVNELFQLDNM